MDKIATLYAATLKQAATLERTPKSQKRSYLQARYGIARARIEMSQMSRSIDFHPIECWKNVFRLRGPRHGPVFDFLVADFQVACTRLTQLTSVKPGEYFILNLHTRQVVTSLVSVCEGATASSQR